MSLRTILAAEGLLASGSCPLRSEAYGGLPGGGGYRANTEFEIGAQQFAEAAHCILGSIGKILAEHSAGWGWEKLLPFEVAHFKEETGIIEKVMGEYSRPLYTERMNNPVDDLDVEYIEDSVKSIQQNSPRLKARAQAKRTQMVGQEDLPDEVRDVAAAAYDSVITLADAMYEATSTKPIGNAYKDPKLRGAVRHLRQTVDRLLQSV